MPRDIAPIGASRYAEDRQQYWHCLKMDWGGGVIDRWTTYPKDTWVADVEKTALSQTWDGTKDWTPGNFEQGDQSILSVSDLVFSNADNSFSDRLNPRVGGVKSIVFTVWEVYFDKDNWLSYIGSWIVYEGVGDREEIGDSVHVGLMAFKHPMTTKFPRRIYSPAHGFNDIPLPNTTFPWGASLATAPPSPAHVFTPIFGPWVPLPDPTPLPGPTHPAPRVVVR